MLTIKTFPFNLLETNCYIVSDETKECVIIDCGAFDPSEVAEVTTYISDNGLKPVHLIATHGHFDHNLGIKAMYDHYGLTAEVHRGDEKILRELPQQTETFLGQTLNAQTSPSIRTFASDEKVTFGSHSFQIIPTPGHTLGGVTFYCKEENVAFTGDTLFRLSIGRTDIPGSSMFMIINSLRYLCQLPDSTVVYPGHGSSTTIGYELAHNPYLDR